MNTYEAGYRDGYEDGSKDAARKLAQGIPAAEVNRAPDSYDLVVDGNVDASEISGTVVFDGQPYHVEGETGERGGTYVFRAEDGRTGSFDWEDVQEFDAWTNEPAAAVWAEADPEYAEGGYGRIKDGEVLEAQSLGAE